jgi:hypothetical protein
MFIPLDLEDPLETNHTMPWQQIRHMPGAIVFNRLHLFDHRLPPTRVLLGFLE